MKEYNKWIKISELCGWGRVAGGKREGQRDGWREREREKFYAFITFHIFIIMRRFKGVHILYHVKTQNSCLQRNQLIDGKHGTTRKY